MKLLQMVLRQKREDDDYQKIYEFSEEADKTRFEESFSATVMTNRGFTNSRSQVLLTKKVLEDYIGLEPNKVFDKFGFYAYNTLFSSNVPDILNLRIRIAHTTSNLTSDFINIGSISGHKYLLGTAEEGVTFDLGAYSSWVNKYVIFDCEEEFQWNGTDSLIIEFTRTAKDGGLYDITEASTKGFFDLDLADRYRAYRGWALDTDSNFPDWFSDTSPWESEDFSDSIMDLYIELK